MNNLQLYFAIVVPTVTVLLGILASFYQVGQLDARFTSMEGHLSSIENRLDGRMSTIESDIKTLVRITGETDTRIARLEVRIAR